MSSVVMVVGSANADHVFRSARLPLAGETVLGSSFDIYPGGKGANQAVAAGRLGADVFFVGSVGRDDDGDRLLSSLQGAGVDTRFVSRSAVATGAAGIFVDDHGRNMIVVAPGANGALEPSAVVAAIESVKPSIVLCQLEVPLPVVEAASLGPRFVLNPAPARPLPDEILGRCFAIVPNETELEAFTSAEALLSKGVQHVIVTLGERGCQWVSADGSRSFPAPTVAAVDTTAAGDVFCGALVTFLAEGLQMDDAIVQANCAAALSTTRPGAQSSAPTRAELNLFTSHP